MSRQTISTSTGKVVEGMVERQHRPLDPGRFPAIVANHVKIRDGQVANRTDLWRPRGDLRGRARHPRLWAGDGGEGAKYWLHVLTELKNRGVADVLMVVCDGLTGLPDAITGRDHHRLAADDHPTCVVHLLRNSFRYAGRQHRDAIAEALKPVSAAGGGGR